MGHVSTILGYVREPMLRGEPRMLVESHNRAKLFGLPKTDIWPPLSRTLFSTTLEQETYQDPLIYFAGTFNFGVDDWDEWIKKFEVLLKSLVWIEAKVFLETDFENNHAYIWKASQNSIKEIFQDVPKPVSDWDFSKTRIP